MTITTQKQFTDKLKGVKLSSIALRENVQALLVYGLEQYRDHTNAACLTDLMDVVSQVKTIPAKTIKAYIGEHANVAYVKNAKTKAMVFRKNGQEVKVTMPVNPWYAHEVNKENAALPDLIDPVAQVKALLTKLAKGREDGLIHPDRKGVIEKMAVQLAEFLDTPALSKEALKQATVVEAQAPAQEDQAA